MSNTEPNDIGSGNSLPEFVWPSPPYFDLPSNDTTSTPEQCVMDRPKGVQLSGRMVRFLSDEAMVEIQPAHASEIQSISFAEFRRPCR